MVSDFESGILVESPSFGMYKLVIAGFEISVVKIKKEISRNPRSTIGVMSILRFAFYAANSGFGTRWICNVYFGHRNSFELGYR